MTSADSKIRTAIAAVLAIVAASAPACQRGRSGDAVTAAGDPALPGLDAVDAALAARLAAAVRARGPSYRPRTRHLLPDGSPRYTNRLVLEASPYLLQHAHNPVNWYPWGDEAFARARREGKPVLLSVGYSTCHWCHVMEEESFEDEEIATYLNRHYVAIKVDREERPDIDTVYMASVQAMTGSGGWPMTVWLDADRRPFFGGTYFPPRTGVRGAGTGLLEALTQLADTYAHDRARIAEAAAHLTGSISAALAAPTAGTIDAAAVLDRAAAWYRDRFDPEYGGLAGARTKFPSSLPVRFLLRYYRRTGDASFVQMVGLTLDRMAASGMYDQIGGGFHRYATDPRWQVPHFEKMLYDNALLVLAYLEAYQVTARADFAATARDVLGYLDRDLGAPEGGFYGASDADSPGPDGHPAEGVYYTWTADELDAALEPAAAALARRAWGVGRAGAVDGRAVLALVEPPADDAARTLLARARAALVAARSRRPPPHRDEKILAAWNGLAISAYARASLVLGDPAYAARAARAADFVLGTMTASDGRLRHVAAGGQAYGAAFLDDHAFLIAGLLDLFEATGEPRWLERALALDRVLARHYEDSAGGFFASADDGERLLAREKPVDDGALPSGNSIAALNLLRLYALTGEDGYRARAERLLAAVGGAIAQRPAAAGELLLALDFATDTPKEIVIVVPASRAEAAAFLGVLVRSYVPTSVVAVVRADDVERVGRAAPLVRGKLLQRGEVTAYVCERQHCELPTRDPAVFARQIRAVAALPPP